MLTEIGWSSSRRNIMSVGEKSMGRCAPYLATSVYNVYMAPSSIIESVRQDPTSIVVHESGCIRVLRSKSN